MDETTGGRDAVSHSGEIAARQRFDPASRWTERKLAHFYRRAIDDETALWIEALPFFFIATADAAGQCDCSFRGRETGPLLRVLTPGELIFPDFPGNGLFNSLGNLLVNPHIGLLFVDFTAQARMRVNGAAALVELDDVLRSLWPRAQQGIRVTVSQVYGNCRQRIPRMVLSAPPREWGCKPD
jgi:predicted pyridoxine 5'-phosphate oxidase superfamily flavin-nucleotide-binding protein